MGKTGVPNPGKWHQFTAAIIMNLLPLGASVLVTWAAPMIPLLQEDHPPVGTTPMTQDQASWLMSIGCIAPMFALPLANILSERFGRKILGCLIAIPMTASWLLTIFANNFSCLMAARILAGMGNGMTIFLVPIYVAEIANNKIRGILGSFLVFAINIGTLLGFVFGATMSYQTFATCGLLLPITFLLGFIFMPETPIYLMRKGRIDAATRSLKWLKGHDEAAVDLELVRLREHVKDTTGCGKTIGCRDLLRDRGTIRGFLIALVLLPGQQACGISVVFMHTVTIFKLAGSSLTPAAASIVLAVVQVFGSWLSIMTIEHAGRRALLLVSCGGMAICHCILGSFFLVKILHYDVSFYTWLPVTALSLYAILYCIGLGPVAFVVASEVLPADVSSFAQSIAMTLVWIFCFINVKIFPFAIEVVGNYGCFFILSFLCTGIFIFTYFFVPETKGKSIESIFDELNGPSLRKRNKFAKNNKSLYDV